MATRTKTVEVAVHDTAPTRCYVYKAMLWVPHHLKVDTYIAPGGKTLPEEVLMRYGAIATTMQLWPRPWRSPEQV